MPMLFWYPTIIAAEIWCMAFAKVPWLTPRPGQLLTKKAAPWANRPHSPRPLVELSPQSAV
jgi:hypothetical protein